MAHDSIRDMRGGDFAWFHRSFLELGLGWKANLAYMGLVTFSNGKTQQCFPSKATLAGLLGVSEMTVFRGLKALESAGVVRIDVRKIGRDQLSNEYMLLPPPVSEGYAPPYHTGVPPISEGYANKKKLNKKKVNKKKSGGCLVLGVEFSKNYPFKQDEAEDETMRAEAFNREATNIANRLKWDIPKAQEWLLERAKTYVNSVHFRSLHPQFVPLAKNWLLGRKYNLPDAVLEQPSSRASKSGFHAERDQLASVV